jgi:predicted ATPase
METKPQLQAVQVTGYRNLEIETPFELSNLNILIGANGSGKSNLLEMIEFLPDALKDGLPETFKKRGGVTHSVVNLDRKFPTEINLSWQLTGDEKLTQGISLRYGMSVEVDEFGRFSVKQEQLEETTPRYPNEPRPYIHLDFKAGKGVASPQPEGGLRKLEQAPSEPLGEPRDLKNSQELALSTLRDSLRYPVLGTVREQALTWSFYHANDMNVRAIKRQPAEIDALQRTLAPNGCNLTMVIYNLTQGSNDGGIFIDYLDRLLGSLYSGHHSLQFPLIGSTHLELGWQMDHPPKSLKLHHLSDGTIRMLCWTAVLANPKLPALISIDEPELGIHPAWLPILAALIQQAAKRTQVIISTHSPELLDEFTSQADKVVVCSQNEQGYAQFERVEAESLQEWLDYYRLGKMFRSGHPELGGWPT